MTRPATLVVVMGVSGCGKSTVGAALAEAMGCAFADADDYHPAANVQKMRSGQPLNDDDRLPWLDTLNAVLLRHQLTGHSLVLACSALRQRYRERLGRALASLHWVHLAGSFELIESRLAARQHRYMPATLLRSQFDALEPPTDALEVSIEGSAEQIVADVLERLHAQRPGYD